MHHEQLATSPLATLQADLHSGIAMMQSAEVSTAQSGASISLANLLIKAMPWLDAMWLMGVVILSLRTAGGWYVIRKLRRSGLVNVPEEVGAMFARLCRRLGIENQIDLYISERVSGPLAMGVLHSVILLPLSAVTHLSPGQLEVVLAHELAHIRRGDYL